MNQMTKSPKSFFKTIMLFGLLCFLSGCSSTTTIYHGLDERDANDIVVFLADKGIKAYKVQSSSSTTGGGQHEILWDISVNSGDETRAMALLRSAGLPRRAGESLLSIFKQGGLVPSEMQQKIRYEAGLGAQIASTIRKIDGVLDARVQLSFPEADPLNPNKKKGEVTASVFVKHNGVLDDPNSQLIPKIRRLVASAVQGLKYENVTVIPIKASYAEMTLPTTREKEKEWVRVWSVVLAKESATRFRIIFFSFLIFILILLLVLGWTFWKIHKILPGGGAKQYFTYHPFEGEEKKEEKPEGEEEEEGEEETVSEKEPVETEAPPEELDEEEE